MTYDRHRTVHPRVCGEQPKPRRNRLSDFGSSPRVRGTALCLHPANLRNRFIPACAGNSFRSVPAAVRETVHPRVCGEQGRTRSSGTSRPGSSPRVRGTDPLRKREQARSRFIPACAGNRNRPRLLRPLETVHPRVCGEQDGTRISPGQAVGSSPRVRGTEAISTSAGETDRFIPACAGNS